MLFTIKASNEWRWSNFFERNHLNIRVPELDLRKIPESEVSGKLKKINELVILSSLNDLLSSLPGTLMMITFCIVINAQNFKFII